MPLIFDTLTKPVTVSPNNLDPQDHSAVIVMGWGVNKVFINNNAMSKVKHVFQV